MIHVQASCVIIKASFIYLLILKSRATSHRKAISWSEALKKSIIISYRSLFIQYNHAFATAASFGWSVSFNCCIGCEQIIIFKYINLSLHVAIDELQGHIQSSIIKYLILLGL